MAQESEQQLCQLAFVFENLPQAVSLTLGPDHRYAFANRAYRELARGKGELVGRTVAEIWPEAAQKNVPQLDHIYRTGETIRAVDEPYAISRDGQDMAAYFTYTWQPYLNPDGKVEGIITFVEETTAVVQARARAMADDQERSRLGELLLTSETAVGKLFEERDAILGSIHDGFMSLDRDWRFTYVNAQAARIAKLTVKEMIGRNIWEMNPGLEQSAIGQAYHRAMNERTVLSETVQGIYSDRIYDVHVYPFQDGISIFFIDKTEQFEAQQALHENQELLYSIIDNANAAIYAKDLEGRFILSNRYHATMLGTTPQNVIGKKNSDFAHTANFSDGYSANDQKVVEQRCPIEFEEIAPSLVGNELVTYLSIKFPLLDADGRLYGVCGISTDITQRKQTEANLKRERELLQALFDRIPVMITMYRPDLHMMQFNPAAERLTGWTAEEARQPGVDFMAEVYPDSKYRAMVEKFMASREGWRDLTLTARDGSLVDSSWSNFLLSDDTQIGIGIDLRERKQIERALLESEKTFKTFFDSSNILASIMELTEDEDLLYLRVNPNMAEFFDLLPEEMNGMSARLLGLDESVLRNWIDLYKSSLKLGKPVSMEYPFFYNGREGWFFATIDQIPSGSSGNPRFGVVIIDITQRKQAETRLVAANAALRESEDRFRALADNIPQLAWMTDETGWIFWYNQRWFDYTGTTLEEMQGWGWQKVHDPEYVEPVTEKFKRCVEAGMEWEDTFPLRGKDGQYRWFLSRAFPIHNEQGRVTRYFGSNTDITEQRNIQKALQVSEERFRVAIENAPILVYTTDRELRYTWIYHSNNGFSDTEVIGKRDDELLPINIVADLIQFKQAALESGKGGRKEIHLNFQGKVQIYDLTAEPLRNEAGEVVGLTVAAIDVTEILSLRSEVGRRSEQVEIQRQISQQQEQERLRIARDIHDGPLQELISASFLVMDIKETNDFAARAEKLDRLIEMLRGQSAELREFCNELRPPALAPFGLEKAIRSHLEQFQIRYPHIKVLAALDRDKRQISESMRIVLFRIYQEALNNVVKHARASEVRIGFRLEESQIMLEICDNGAGFEVPGNWVQMARQGHLGLVGMRERVESVNGRLEIQSAPGEGTRLEISAPWTQDVSSFVI